MMHLKQGNEVYFSHDRNEMLQYVPKVGRYFLEVGCGNGLFGKIVKERRNCVYWGVEPDSEASKEAANYLDKVFTGVFDESVTFNNQKFDCIIFNDVLEHMIDPWKVLKYCHDILNPGGVIVTSIPNFLYYNNIKKLIISGDWKYENSGILDKTHLRFFTKKSILRMFIDCGFLVERIDGINPLNTWKFNLLYMVSFGSLEKMKYLQYATVVKKDLS